MGVYARDMKIPESCWKCPFHDEDYCYPGDMSIDRNHHSDRSKYCPLIEIPDGHGRLISARAAKWAFDDAIMEEAKVTGIVLATSDEIAKVIASVPTIIPADKE